MDNDERETAPADYYGTEPGIECACGCEREVNEDDPCMIDGELFSDHCASNLIALRLDGWIKSVSDRTAKIKDKHNLRLYNKAAFAVHPQRRVNHI